VRPEVSGLVFNGQMECPLFICAGFAAAGGHFI